MAYDYFGYNPNVNLTPNDDGLNRNMWNAISSVGAGSYAPRDPQAASDYEGFSNLLTGNLDYARTLYTLAREQEFSEYMSNTAYQRQAADLKAAGYNPALVLGTGGASASSPGATVQSAGKGVSGLFNGLLSMISSVAANVMKDRRQMSYLVQQSEIADKKLELGEKKLEFYQDVNDARTKAMYDIQNAKSQDKAHDRAFKLSMEKYRQYSNKEKVYDFNRKDV